VCTLYLAVVVPLVASLAFLLVWLRRGRPLRELAYWIGAQLAAAALLLPWLLLSAGRMPTWSSAEPVSLLEFLRLYVVMLAVGVPVNVEAYLVPALGSLAILLAGLAALIRARRTARQTAGMWMLVLGVVLPALIVFVFALPIEIPFGRLLAPRYFLPLAVCFYALLAWGLSALARRRQGLAWLGAALVVSSALLGLASLYPGRARRDDLVSLAGALAAHRRPDDAVLLHTDKDWPLFAAQYAGEWSGVPYGAPLDEGAVDRLLQKAWERAEAVWLVTTPDAQRADPASLVRGWLERRAEAMASWSFAESDLAVYARTPGRAAALYDLAPGSAVPDNVSRELAPGVTLLGSWLGLPRYLVGDTAHLFLYWEDLPADEIAVSVSGAVEKAVGEPPPPAASTGATLQQVDLPLTPDLPPGGYCLSVCAADGCVHDVACFDLVRRGAGSVAALGDIGHLLDVRLGASIVLLGYDLDGAVVEPGGTVELTLYWQAAEIVERRYKVFTHIVGETWNASTGDFLWGQVDSEPVNSQVPTTVWAPGQVIADSYQIPLADDAPAGEYAIVVGLYGLVDGARLPVFDSGGAQAGDSVTLAQVEVRAP
jgi:sorbitol-specific phosphotransferase system component IIC